LVPDFLMTTRFLLGYVGVGIVAFLIGAALVWTWARQAIELARMNSKAEAGSEREEEVRELSVRLAASEQRGLIFEEAKQRMEDAFRALSAEALRANNQTFLEIAQERMARTADGAKAELDARERSISNLVGPLKEKLAAVDLKIGELEKNRVGAYEGLRSLMGAMDESQRALRMETANLVKALQSPVVRGRWGEIQLRRVVELSGMLAHCDFVEQESVETADGRMRPDMRVILPGGNNVVVDSKVPLMGYLEAVQSTEQSKRRELMARHASQVRTHVDQLSKKAYWEQFESAPEFVVLFLPGEVFFSAALEEDPELISYAAEKRVILASPTTLIALLRAVHFGWRQDAVARNAADISALGKELHKRLGDFAGHLVKLGGSLGSAVEQFNKANGSFETRVLVSARKFEALGASNPDAPLPEVVPIERLPVSGRGSTCDDAISQIELQR
jgi:DNA recombination protein RmuC